MRTFIAIVLIAQVAAYGQQPGAPNVPKGTYKFEVNSQLVVVNVSAKDKNGAPLDRLKPADFTTTEDGKAQQVKVFEFQRLEEAADLTPPAAPGAAAAVKPEATPVATPAKAPATIAPAKAGEVKRWEEHTSELH